MSDAAPITLLTDFGLEDPYVGVLKAVLLRECAAAPVIDLTHALAAYDKVTAAFWIERVFPWFPAGTVHIVVVDPGVGSERRALVISAHRQLFVGPDNGILSGIFARDPQAEAYQIDERRVGVPLSRTFHGRDLFAPVAGRLARGVLTIAEVGERVGDLCAAVLPAAEQRGNDFFGQVVTVDRFGNALTNLEQPLAGRFEVLAAGRRWPLFSTYADGARAEIFGIFGSFGTLELAMREGHAAAALGLGQGAPVVLCRIG